MSELYNYEYYHNYCGGTYEEPACWMKFFGSLADRIVNDLKPKTVLDAGCAMGYLVAALRDRGVEAYGVDISEYAISKVREDIKQYCAVGSLTEPLPTCLPKRYDLVVTIEVLEHLYEEDGRKAIKSLCGLTNQIIFSSTPDISTELTHFNVQQREYWARLFAAEGFWDDINYRPQYISKQAVYLKKHSNYTQLAEDFERFIRVLETENISLTNKLSQQIQRIKERDTTIQEHIDMVHERDERIAEQLAMIQARDDTIREHIAMVHERDERIAEQLAMIQARDNSIHEHIAMVQERDKKKAEQQAELLEQNTKIANQDIQIQELRKIIQKYTPPWIRKRFT